LVYRTILIDGARSLIDKCLRWCDNKHNEGMIRWFQKERNVLINELEWNIRIKYLEHVYVADLRLTMDYELEILTRAWTHVPSQRGHVSQSIHTAYGWRGHNLIFHMRYNINCLQVIFQLIHCLCRGGSFMYLSFYFFWSSSCYCQVYWVNNCLCKWVFSPLYSVITRWSRVGEKKARE
jgi:hypothetical protein